VLFCQGACPSKPVLYSVNVSEEEIVSVPFASENMVEPQRFFFALHYALNDIVISLDVFEHLQHERLVSEAFANPQA